MKPRESPSSSKKETRTLNRDNERTQGMKMKAWSEKQNRKGESVEAWLELLNKVMELSGSFSTFCCC